MRLNLLSLLFGLILTPLFCQKTYFQQEVHTRIRVQLDDVHHTLTGDIEIEYHNHSPHTLHEIWLHCWANAYSSNKTALAKQFLKTGNRKFHFASPKERGGYKNLDFRVNGEKLRWSFDNANPDIVQLKLNEPLPPEGKLLISTPLFLIIPASFSRLGHVGQSYQMTQWFPKPAVYDLRGWHAMPYLNMGEFYSEFGNYDVSITLPENYVVAATGILQTAEELLFIQKKIVETEQILQQGLDAATARQDSFPPTSKKWKTVRFVAQQVHDFAWFADKRFMITRDSARLPSGKVIPTWAFFTKSSWQTWQKGAFYVRRAVEFYSKLVGEYPWPHATAVHSALSAGGGMEYPMITVVNSETSASALDRVITHEVGHNWFYGMLASHERKHAWMDEGMNSYYENRYMKTYYQDDLELNLPKLLYRRNEHGKLNGIACRLLAHVGADIPPDTPCDRFSQVAYGVQVYIKAAYYLHWLEKSVGTAKWDAAMQDYFVRWKMKHPYPADFQKVMKDNGIDVSWFIEAMRTQKYADFSIKKMERAPNGDWHVTLKNQGKLEAPVCLSVMQAGVVVEEKWFATKEKTTHIQISGATGDALHIDAQENTLDQNRRNNFGRPLLRPLQFRWLPVFETPHRQTIGWSPWLGGNRHDGWQLGLLLYNAPLPGQRLQYYLAPAFGTKTKKGVGLADIRLRQAIGDHPLIRLVTLGVSTRSWHFDRQGHVALRFWKLQPFFRIDFRTRSHHQFWWSGRLLRLTHDYVAATLPDNTWSAIKSTTTYLAEARIQFRNIASPRPFTTDVWLETRNEGNWNSTDVHLRVGFSHVQSVYYQQNKKITGRLYTGFFIHNLFADSPEVGFEGSDAVRASLSLSQANYTDYKYDHLFFGRREQGGFWSRQIAETEGGFKYAFGKQNRASAGHSNRFLMAINVKSDLPFDVAKLKNPLQVYFDWGVVRSPGRTHAFENFWSGGLSLSFLQNHLNVYFPLLNSKNLSQGYRQMANRGWLGRVTWSILLNDMEPVSLGMRLLR